MNTYNPAKMGIAEGIALVFGMLMSRMFVSSIALQISEVRQGLLLGMLIDHIISFLIIMMLVYVQKKVSGDIVNVCRHLVGKFGAWVIIAAYICMFFGNSALLLRQYAEYTIHTALPRVDFQLVIAWYAMTVGILCYIGIEALARTGYILLPLLVFAMTAIFVMLKPFYIVYNLVPWQGNGLLPSVQGGINGVGYDFGILALIIMAPAFQNTTTIKRAALYSIGTAVVIKIWFVLVYIMVFGTIVGSEKSMPFFELARLVYLNLYIQRMESLFIVIWVFFGILAVAGSLYMALYLIATLFKLPTIRPIVPISTIIIANLAIYPQNIGAAIAIDQRLLIFFNIGMYIFPSILFIRALFKRRKKLCSA